MLAGVQDEMSGEPLSPNKMDFSVGESMFETMGQPPTPSTRGQADQMAAAMAAVQVDRKAEVKEIVARTYDLGDATDRNQYQYDLENLHMGIRMKTHEILMREPLQFVNDSKNPRYIAHMQWIEYRLLQTPVATTGGTKE